MRPQGDEVVAQLKCEMHMYSTLRHPNVIRVFGSASRALVHGSGVEVGILMEYCPGAPCAARVVFKCSPPTCVTAVVCTRAALHELPALPPLFLCERHSDAVVGLCVTGGNLFDVLAERQSTRHHLSQREVLDLCIPTCRAIAYLHSLPTPIAHRDIKVKGLKHHRARATR